MTIIDRYLTLQFLRAFGIFLLSFTGLYVVVDFFGNMEEFLAVRAKQGGLIGLLVEYYGYRTLSFFNLTSGIVALIAAMFTLATFQRSNELTALLAAGISKRRIVCPVIIAGAIVAVVAVAIREIAIPAVRDKLEFNAQSLVAEAGKALAPRYDNKTNIFFRGGRTLSAERRIDKPELVLPGELAEHGKHLAAEAAVYEPAADGRPGGYRLVGVSLPKDLAARPSLDIGNDRIVYSPHDTPWLAANECFVASDLTFELLDAGPAFRQYASTPELIAALHNESAGLGADVRVAVHSRIVQPFLDVTLLLLGLPLVLTRESRNVFVSIALCGAVVVAFMLVVLACQYLGASYWIDPARAAWLPLIIFVPTAMLLAEPLME